jgi:hypothetical protein
MTGSIGQLAEQVLAEVKSGAMTKIAEVQILNLAEETARVQTVLGKSMVKLATSLRSKTSGISMDELKNFLWGLR